MNRIITVIIAVAIVGGGLGWLLGSSKASAQDSERQAAAILADVGTDFTYQGKLEQNNLPVNLNCDFEFRLFDAVADGTQVGVVDAQSSVPVTDGLFTVTLNTANEFGTNAFIGQARWLEIRVRCPAGSLGWTILAPRQPLTPAPHAFSLRPGAIISASNEVGLTVSNASTTSSSAGLLGQMTSTSQGSFSAGVRGINDGTSGNGIGVWGSQNGGGWGVFGTSNDGRGVYGRSFNTNGVGVYGLHEATDGANPGVYGETDSTEGSAAGVIGKVDSSSPGGYSAGVRGINDGTSGSGIGVYGSHDGSGWGVYGETQTGMGVYGKALGSTNTNYGVFGRTASDSGYAGYFYGRVNVNGTLSKAAGSFMIDHPLDPENQYLYHSFVESPDMKNIYDGVTTLDSSGEALVKMPDWFEALNQDFRYQLTPIGAPMPGLYIAQEVQDNRFRIAGGEPGMKVSWQVTGIRHDPYAEQNRIPVEEAKPADERGSYLYPQGYGQPASTGRDYVPIEEVKAVEPTTTPGDGQQ